MPGVAFDISDPANVRPALTNIKRIHGIVTYGRPRTIVWYMADPPRKLVTRYLRWLTGGARAHNHALYHMNVADEPRRRRFMARVRAAMARL